MIAMKLNMPIPKMSKNSGRINFGIWVVVLSYIVSFIGILFVRCLI